ncbi:MAG: response regulator, partial [bacterium]
FKELAVLVVDDNHTNRFILHKTLTAWDFKVMEAQSGSEALSLLQNTEHNFDLVILDHQMPEMDGIEVVRAIRKDTKNKDIKIIMLSSWNRVNSRLQQELHIDCNITKPVKQSMLHKVLMEVLRVNKGEQVAGTESMPSVQGPNNSHHRILLVEDNEDNQALGKKILEKAGYNVDIVSNGQLAVEAAKKLQYDLILMDVQMPVMDGLKAAKKIRLLERRSQKDRVPIIALTAHAVHGYRDKCLIHDMDDYITKPLKRKALLEKVSQWIEPQSVN